MNSPIIPYLNNFNSISLSEMNEVALMKRVDTKFILDEFELVSVLESIKQNYSILEVNQLRFMTYNSLYFDTSTMQFYLDHHNGKLTRTKIRMRNYVESELSFLEIKQKDSKGNTNKSRMRIQQIEPSINLNIAQYIERKTKQRFDLSPHLWNQFNRFTLVNKTAKERVTIDLNIQFKIGDQQTEFKRLAVIEVKQEQFNRQSHIISELKKRRIHPNGFSKYCIGMISLNPDLKYNSFKKKILTINKIIA